MTTRSYQLHLKKILVDLANESSLMESKLFKASTYHSVISYMIFYPSIILNTFIGSFVLTFSCSSADPRLASCAAMAVSGTIDDNCENILADGNLLTDWPPGVERMLQVFLASLAFLNAILLGLQKSLRPSENAEVFQLAARKWGAYLRKVVAYKQTTQQYSSKKVKFFVSQYNLMTENAPMLPRWLLKRQPKESINES
jgi:hypothetical protein